MQVWWGLSVAQVVAHVFSGSSCLMNQADDKILFLHSEYVSLNVVELNCKDLFGLSGLVWP